MELVDKIKNCKTMPELDELRLPIVKLTKGDAVLFKKVQSEFVKKKNKLKRIPLNERNW